MPSPRPQGREQTRLASLISLAMEASPRPRGADLLTSHFKWARPQSEALSQNCAVPAKRSFHLPCIRRRHRRRGRHVTWPSRH